MGFTKIAFPSLAWVEGGNRLERKKADPGRGATLLEFAPGFADPNWCERSHVLFVVSGVLDIELEAPAARVERLSVGECAWLDRGTRHRVRNPGREPVTLFIVSDVRYEPTA